MDAGHGTTHGMEHPPDHFDVQPLFSEDLLYALRTRVAAASGRGDASATRWALELADIVRLSGVLAEQARLARLTLLGHPDAPAALAALLTAPDDDGHNHEHDDESAAAYDHGADGHAHGDNGHGHDLHSPRSFSLSPVLDILGAASCIFVRKAHTGVKIVGPQITWGTMPGYQDPVVWMDAFYAAYRAAHGGRDPQVDHLGFHWYDYGLKDQLDRLAKYGKPFWVTEMANWQVGDGAAAIDSVEKQMAQMTEMVALCEGRANVIRYAWFTGRGGADLDDRFTTLHGADGLLTALGRHYLSLPAA